MTSFLEYDDQFDMDSPVVRLKSALPVGELLNNHMTEFEVRPEEDEMCTENTSAESCFSFDDLAKVTNLSLIDIGQDDAVDGDTPFDRYRNKMDDIRKDEKLKKFVVRQGMGVVIPDKSIVYVRYHAHLEYSELPFDSTLWQCDGKSDIPVAINLGKGQILPGLHEALLTMKKGEKAEFLIHPDLAYGSLGCPPRVPPDATVLFIVEVDRFVDCGEANTEPDDLSMEERSKYCNVIRIAKANYLQANDSFLNKKYSAAVHKYRQVINMMHNARLADEKEEIERNRFLLKNYTNACVCYHKLKNYKRVCIMASDAVRVDPKEAFSNFKLLYFWGYAKMVLSDFAASKRHLMAAQKLAPLDRDIANALKELDKRKNTASLNEKLMMKKAFGFTPSTVKITEINEDEDEFTQMISEQLTGFNNDPKQDSLTLRDNFTRDEEKICLRLAKEMGLYARVADGGKRVILINKYV